MFATATEACDYISRHEIDMVDLKVAALNGRWLHITIPARTFGEKHFVEGVGFDGSSGAGFGRVDNSDVAALPQPDTAFLDPFWAHPTISFLCDIVQADSKMQLAYDPRSIARRAVQHLQERGIADRVLVGPEYEFYVFDRVQVNRDRYDCGVRIQSSEVGEDGSSPAIASRQGYMHVPPGEHLHDLRSQIALTLQSLDVEVRYHHHEVGAAGQCELEVDLTDLLRAADQAMLIKYVVKNSARRAGKLATFMPKPVYAEAGSGMHVHQRLERDGINLFHSDRQERYAQLSDTALGYIAGLLSHGRALTGLTNPSTNSFKRLVEGHEAPVDLFFSLANRSAAIRIPRYAVGPADKRIEYRPPDFTGNVYLSLAAMVMAGLDGVSSGLDPCALGFGPFDGDVSGMPVALRENIAPLPRSLPDALDALATDHAFLTAGGVFPEELLRAWIDTKRLGDAREVAARPHPYEYELYLDT